MNIKVYKDRDIIKIDNDVYGTQNENNITELKIEVPKQYQNWNKRIVFLTDEGNFWDYIKDDTYTIKNNITKYEELEAYIWLTENTESIEESVNDFRSRTFRLSFFANIDADNLVPDEKQIDGFNTMLTALNVEIEEVKQINTDFTKLKQEVEQAETSRNTAENSRIEAEKKREEKQKEFLENLEAGKYNGSSGIAVQPDEPTKEDIIMWFDTDDEEDNYLDLEDVVEITNNLKEVAPLTNLEIEEIVHKIL